MTLYENMLRKYRDILNYFFGGAILAKNSTIIVGENTNILISRNIAGYGGAIYLWKNSVLIVNRNAIINFISNTARTLRGAISLEESCFSITNATLLFRNNTAVGEAGWAISLIGSRINIREHANVTFINNMATLQGGAVYQSISGHISIDIHSRLEFYSNSAGQGGALYLTSPGSLVVGHNSFILFANNSALEVGGAVYAYTHLDLPCFLFLMSYSSVLKFEENSATNGGLHIYYGASIRSAKCGGTELFYSRPYCGTDLSDVSLMPDVNNSLSLVSSDPKRVCLCDPSGQPQCANLSYIFVNAVRVYPGELIKLSLVVVGHDFGVTTGTVHGSFMSLNASNSSALDDDQYHQLIESSRECSILTYTIYSANKYEIFYLQTATNRVNSYGEKSRINTSISKYISRQNGCLNPNLLTTPVFINLTLLRGCPPGFAFHDQLQGCSCYSILQTNQFSCSLANNTGYLRWNSTMWVAADTNENSTTEQRNHCRSVLVSQYCPLEHCRSDEKIIDLSVDSDAQCAFNHAGVLCGACRKNYSLAIGSSHCIKCSSDSYLALLIFFIAAGVLLVIFLFLFKLTVTEGLVNGLIFYANILWIYKSILFQQTSVVLNYFQVYIAWLNLDFGIETCFIVGLNAFWKMWLQFLFPLYIWLIAGVIIMACRYSSRLTNLIGGRAVPLLSTLFLLSYMKLLRTIVTVFGYSILTQYPSGSNIVVWYRDGNLLYCQHPHIYLFITSSAILVLLCIPFTLFLLLIQCWRRVSHRRGLRWINKFTPVYDACFAPLHNRHHHFFGTLLIVRGVLLFIFILSSDSDTSLTTNLLVLWITMVMLLLYVIFLGQVYKSRMVKIFDSISFLNLIILSGVTLYAGGKRTVYLEVSIGFAFVQFCVIVLLSLINVCFNTTAGCLKRDGYQMVDKESDINYERIEDPEIDAEMTLSVRSVTVDTY